LNERTASVATSFREIAAQQFIGAQPGKQRGKQRGEDQGDQHR
jgi:hypothetical protein